MDVGLARFGPGDPEAGNIYGVTVNLAGFRFVVSVTVALNIVRRSDVRVFDYRPAQFRLGPYESYFAVKWADTTWQRDKGPARHVPERSGGAGE